MTPFPIWSPERYTIVIIDGFAWSSTRSSSRSQGRACAFIYKKLHTASYQACGLKQNLPCGTKLNKSTIMQSIGLLPMHVRVQIQFILNLLHAHARLPGRLYHVQMHVGQRMYICWHLGFIDDQLLGYNDQLFNQQQGSSDDYIGFVISFGDPPVTTSKFAKMLGDRPATTSA